MEPSSNLTIFSRGVGEQLEVVATPHKIIIKKFWTDFQSVKKIALEPIVALSILQFHESVTEYWSEVQKETAGLAKYRSLISLPDPSMELSQGISIRAFPVEEKVREGRNIRFDLRLFLNVSIKNGSRCFGSRAIELIAPEFESLAHYLRDFSQFLADFVTTDDHKKEHHEPSCCLCHAYLHASVRAHTINLSSMPVVTFGAVASTIEEALISYWGPDKLNSFSLPKGELRLTIRGDPVRKLSQPRLPTTAARPPSSLNFGKIFYSFKTIYMYKGGFVVFDLVYTHNFYFYFKVV